MLIRELSRRYGSDAKILNFASRTQKAGKRIIWFEQSGPGIISNGTA